MVSIFLTLSIIIFPEDSLHASVRGLHIWGEVVFPSLLPFFITAELLISFGTIQFIGVLFEPVMRPLFKIPGAGSFAWMVGMASGYPTGAKISASLREKNELSQVEAERLVSFSNASSPLFIFGAVAVGFLHNAKLGLFIAICHYLSNVLVGICMRFYGKNQENSFVHSRKYEKNLFIRAFQKMHHTRTKDHRPFGQIIGDAVLSSIQTLIMVGGFIIIFSVFTSLLNVTSIMEIGHFMLKPILHLLNIPPDVIVPFFTGIFEVTMGAEMISNLDIPLIMQLALISFLLGFNGFSIQAQVASILSKTDIRFYPYFLGRILHAIFASIITVILYKMYFENKLTIQDTIATPESSQAYVVMEYLVQMGPMITITSITIAAFLLLDRYLNNYES